MQQNNSIQLKFILITEKISFIPDNILNCSEIISVPRPTKANYNKCLKNKLPVNVNIENITNIKNIHSSIDTLMTPYKIICDKIIDSIYKIEELKFLKFRDLLYDIFIYNLDITDCIWYIISVLITQKKIKKSDTAHLMIKTYTFFQYYNNNYRPIYHLENYLFYITSLIHGYTI
jgi:hypothetical protein